MDFIERVFGVAPDAGSGNLEAALTLAVVAAIALAVIVRMHARSARRG
jgi:hypothetical protein